MRTALAGVTIGSICFVVYISVAAINMVLQTLYSTQEYVSSYLTLPATGDRWGNTPVLMERRL